MFAPEATDWFSRSWTLIEGVLLAGILGMVAMIANYLRKLSHQGERIDEIFDAVFGSKNVKSDIGMVGKVERYGRVLSRHNFEIGRAFEKLDLPRAIEREDS